MKTIQLIYFQGCPNAMPMKEKLTQAGAGQIDEFIQGELPVGHPYIGYSSPTVLLGEQVLFGAKTDADQGGCSLSLPNLGEVKHWFA